jgi:hypothetical protein
VDDLLFRRKLAVKVIDDLMVQLGEAGRVGQGSHQVY